MQYTMITIAVMEAAAKAPEISAPDTRITWDTTKVTHLSGEHENTRIEQVVIESNGDERGQECVRVRWWWWWGGGCGGESGSMRIAVNR
jgi:hypothetical protein